MLARDKELPDVYVAVIGIGAPHDIRQYVLTTAGNRRFITATLKPAANPFDVS
jgi:hypothetical protein